MKIKPQIRGGGDDNPSEDPKIGASARFDETGTESETIVTAETASGGRGKH